MKLLPLLALILLAGCAAPMVWEKPGSAEAEFYQADGRARARAIREVRDTPQPAQNHINFNAYPGTQYNSQPLYDGVSAGMNSTATAIERENYYRSLMQAEGWRLVPAPKRAK